MSGAPAPDAGPAEGLAGELDDRALRMLRFEHRAFGHPAAKAEAIRAEFGVSAARYYRILGDLIDAPAALRHDPMLVNRLLRMREARAVARERRSPTAGRTLD